MLGGGDAAGEALAGGLAADVGGVLGDTTGGFGALPSGGDDPGGEDLGSGLIRPKSTSARRILKKYMTTIANANAMSSPMVKR